jgi:hypothetical protein
VFLPYVQYACVHAPQKSPKNTLFCVLAIFSSRILALAKANTADKPNGLSRGSTQDKAKFGTQNRARIIFIWLTKLSKKADFGKKSLTRGQVRGKIVKNCLKTLSFSAKILYNSEYERMGYSVRSTGGEKNKLSEKDQWDLLSI